MIRKQMVLPYFIASVSLVLAKVFVNGTANYGRADERELSLPLHIMDNAMFLLFLVYFLCLLAKNPRMRINGMAVFFFLLYGIGLFLTPLSGIPLMTFYQGVRGLFFTLIGVVFVFLTRGGDRDESYRRFFGFSTAVFVMGLLGSSIVAVKVLGFSLSLLTRGMAGSFFSLIGFFCFAMLLKSDKSRVEKIVVSALIAFLSFKFNSISSLLAFILGYFIFLLRKRQYARLAIYTMTIAVATVAGIAYLQSHVSFIIANKSSSEILEGSGRFAVYQYAWDVLSSGGAGWLGAGLGAERLLLEQGDLLWSHTAHNSFLTLSLGMGVLGSSFYLAFTFLWWRVILRAGSGREDSLLAWIASSLFFYGLTSPSYPGTPGFLIPYAIVLYEVMLVRQRIPSAPGATSKTGSAAIAQGAYQ